jgi:hypothetical protein
MTRPRRRRLASLAAGLLLLAAAPPAPAAPPSAAFLQGTDWFRRILHEMDCQPLQGYDELAADPAHTLLIVLGDAGPLAEVPGGLEAFVRKGGGLLYASDQRAEGAAREALLRTTGVEVAGEFLVCNQPAACYRGRIDCPFLSPAGDGLNLFHEIPNSNPAGSTVATNAPSYLRGTGKLRMAATLPGVCQKETPDFLGDNQLEAPLFAAGGKPTGEGRVLVLADHSVFINEMLIPGDENNFEFARNCIQYVQGDPIHPRRRVLFVEEGVINAKFDVPVREIPDTTSLEKKLNLGARAAERLLVRMDENDGYNGFLRRSAQEKLNLGPEGLTRWLLIAATALGLLYAAYRFLGKARRRADAEAPPLAGAVADLAPSGTMQEQRRQAMLRANNLYEAARDLAREALAACPAEPTVVVHGNWGRRRAMQARVRWLWRLAHGPAARVSLEAWRRLLREVDELRAGLADGSVRLT